MGAAAVLLLMAATAGAPDQFPPPPELDKTPVTGLSPAAVAARALGPAADEFVDRRDYAMHPMVPGNPAGATFYLRPRAVAPGLCGVRFLYVVMKRRRLPDGGEALSAQQAHWAQRFKVVRVDELRPPGPAADLGPTHAACEALQPSTTFIYDMSGRDGFDAPSAEAAWRHAVLLKTVVRSASRQGRLGFRLSCEDFTGQACAEARLRLGRLSAGRLVAAGKCVRPPAAGDCYAMFVEGHARDRTRHDDAEWRIEVVTRPGRLDQPTHVSIEYHVPPVI